MQRYFTTILQSATALTFVLASPAFAQNQGNDTTPTSSAPTGVEEIEVVSTGTLIRGIAPQASQVISVDAAAIETSGVSSATDLLAKIPQMQEFNTLPGIQAVNGVELNSTPLNLRQLPGAGGTLLLVDGHRIPGAGTKGTAPDPDVLPPLVIERVDSVTDGGASLYGADAVGGVVNFITRRSFDGVKVGARYGHAPQYDSYDYNGIVGKDWGAGSAYVAYNYTKHDKLYGRDRDYVQRLDWATGQLGDLSCAKPNIQIAGTSVFYDSATLMPAAPTRCDNSDNTSFYNDEQRHSVFANVSQDFGSGISFDLRAWYTHRERERDTGPFDFSTTLTAANPYYRDTGDAYSGFPQTIYFNTDPLVGSSALDKNTFDVWGVTPTLSVDLPHEWQLRALLNYGESAVEARESYYNSTAFLGGLFFGVYNPYDIGSTPAALKSAAFDYVIYGKSKQKLGNSKLVMDGPLFKLPGPGGDLRAAVGVEYIYEEYKSRARSAPIGMEDTIPRLGGNRSTYAVFSELNFPIVEEGSGIPGVDAFNVSVSGRFDSYTDIGDTLNPRVGVNYKPWNWLNLRGSWSTSFTAPPLSTTRAPDNTSFNIPATLLTPPPPPYPGPVPGQRTVGGRGGDPNANPQTATIYSAGFDFEPPELDGLTLSMTYYHILFEDLIDIPPVQTQAFYTLYPDKFLINPTLPEALTLVAGNPDAEAVVAAQYAAMPYPYAILDGRRTNLGSTRLSGIDFSADYRHPVSYGDFFVNLGGTYRLTKADSPAPGSPYLDTVKSETRLRFATSVGTNIDTDCGTILAQVTLNYLGGFDVVPSPISNNNQSRVDAFKTVDLFLKYDLTKAGWTDGLSFTAGLYNALDEDPSTFMGTFGTLRHGFANGDTVGRMFQFGVSKQF